MGCCVSGNSTFEQEGRPLSFPVLSSTQTSVTLIRVKRSELPELGLPSGLNVASPAALKHFLDSNGDRIGDDSFIVGLQADLNSDFGPVALHNNEIDFALFKLIIPFCQLPGDSSKQFWTYFSQLASSKRAAKLLTHLGYKHEIEVAELSFEGGFNANAGGYRVTSTTHTSVDAGVTVDYDAKGDFRKMNAVDKQELSLLINILKQPYISSPSLKVGGATTFNTDTIKFRAHSNTAIAAQGSFLPAPVFKGSVVTSVDLQLTLHETNPQRVPFQVNHSWLHELVTLTDKIAGAAEGELKGLLQDMAGRFENEEQAIVGDKGRQWHNVLGNEVVKPTKLASPSTLAELVELHKTALRQGDTVKAVGSGHSYSACLQTTGVLVETHSLDKPASNANPIEGQLKKKLLKKQRGNDPALVFADDPANTEEGAMWETQAGVTIQTLIQQLEEQNLALSNMGGAAWQTLAGYCSTSTHGTGITYGPVCNTIKSLVLVTTGALREEDNAKEGHVFVYRIEPSNGITDWLKYAEDAQPQDPMLIQDDRVFNAVTTNFGTMGVTYSMVIEVEQMYWLKQTAVTKSWSDISKPGVLQDILEQNLHVTVLLDPYPTDVGDHDIVLSISNKIPATTDRCPVLEHPVQAVEAFFFGFLESTPISFSMIKYLMMAVPSISRKLLSAALKSQQQFGNKQGKYYDVLELHVEENGGFASEWAFPMQKPDEDSKQQVLPVPFHVWPTSEQPPKNNKQNWTMETLNKAVKAIGDEVKALADADKAYASSPMGIRFVNHSPSYMSMMNGCITSTIELDLAYGTPNGVYILKELGDKLLAIGGRYHWGLNFTQCIGATPLANMYPRFGDFQAQLNRANALGTYNNRYTKDLGLSADAGGKRRSLREQVCDEDQGNTNSSAKAGNDANAPLLMMQVN